MWICEKCGRSFAKTNQGHYCGKAPSNVDEYINLQLPICHSHLKTIREIIKNNIKDVNEKISWSMPTYEKEGDNISFVALKDRLSLYVGEEIIKEFEDQLIGIPTKKSAIYFRYDEELPTELIIKIVKRCFNK